MDPAERTPGGNCFPKPPSQCFDVLKVLVLLPDVSHYLVLHLAHLTAQWVMWVQWVNPLWVSCELTHSLVGAKVSGGLALS